MRVSVPKIPLTPSLSHPHRGEGVEEFGSV